ncbi:recombinase family protein [Streptomyces sp. R302]|uniref:recombinase family protein n=1 Tax=unclassified Streptomyces TaxID=2593676 RepID=UPI00145ED1B4|nr:recombinase family protein [Streptomyces sp. R301]NML79567.1 recombinase family protein [Streptomyces sp. R302]
MKPSDTFRSPLHDEGGEPWLGYIRVSTYKEEKISPEIQREAITQWAARTGRRIVKWVTDLDVSGRHFKRKITKCVESVEGGDAYGVAVWKYSRFGRDRTGNALWLAKLEAAGGQLESATEPVDASTAIGRFQRGMILEFAAFESDRAGEQWKETHEHRQYKLGLPASGGKRFGYVWHRRWNPETETLQKERYEPDQAIAPVVADLYRAYVAGKGFPQLVQSLNGQGHRNNSGGLWSTDTLRWYMDSGFPAGLLRVHDPEHRCRKKDGNCRSKIYIQGTHEELIEFALWTAYLARRQTVRTTKPRARSGTYELAGLPTCGGCRSGTSLNTRRRHGSTTTEPGYSYRCTRRAKYGRLSCEGVLVPRSIVEKEVTKWLKERAADGIDNAPSTDVSPRRDLAAEQATRARARVQAQAEVDRHRAAIARLRADHAANPDDWEQDEYEDALALARKKRADAQAQLDSFPDDEPLPDRAEAEALIAGAAEAWDALDARQRNALLRQLVRRVVLTRTGPGLAEVTVHPVWEPDPWADLEPVSRGVITG